MYPNPAEGSSKPTCLGFVPPTKRCSLLIFMEQYSNFWPRRSSDKKNLKKRQQISSFLKPAASLALTNQNSCKMTRGDSSVNLLLVSRSKGGFFMYSPGQITATKTAGGGFPQNGGLVQGVPPKKSPQL